MTVLNLLVDLELLWEKSTSQEKNLAKDSCSRLSFMLLR
nr:MAG TPA: hypothetical protein [Caudoviricetes sp.]